MDGIGAKVSSLIGESLFCEPATLTLRRSTGEMEKTVHPV